MKQAEIVAEMVREGLSLPFDEAYGHFKALIQIEPKLIGSRIVQSWIVANRVAITKKNRKERENGRA